MTSSILLLLFFWCWYLLVVLVKQLVHNVVARLLMSSSKRDHVSCTVEALSLACCVPEWAPDMSLPTHFYSLVLKKAPDIPGGVYSMCLVFFWVCFSMIFSFNLIKASMVS